MDGSNDILINLEGVAQGKCSFMNVDTTPLLQKHVRHISPASIHEEHQLGSSDAEEIDDEEEEAESEGETLR